MSDLRYGLIMSARRFRIRSCQRCNERDNHETKDEGIFKCCGAAFMREAFDEESTNSVHISSVSLLLKRQTAEYPQLAPGNHAA